MLSVLPVGMTKTLHEPTPSPLWGEGWGEGKTGKGSQPTSAIRHLLPARLALLQKGFQPLLALGADANAGDAVLGVTAQRLAERSAADLAQQILADAHGLRAVQQQRVDP